MLNRFAAIQFCPKPVRLITTKKELERLDRLDEAISYYEQ